MPETAKKNVRGSPARALVGFFRYPARIFLVRANPIAKRV
jgi:hypothetical protein